MRTLAVLMWVGVTAVSGCGKSDAPPVSQNAADEKAAVAVAEAWLALVDDAKYAESWEGAAALFRAAVDNEKWVATMKGFRTPLGAKVSRTVKTCTHATTMPGAPDGEYVVIQFDTSFEKKNTAVETVTPMKEKDGTWRIAGYTIK